jgi:hypothetical protein
MAEGAYSANTLRAQKADGAIFPCGPKVRIIAIAANCPEKHCTAAKSTTERAQPVGARGDCPPHKARRHPAAAQPSVRRS